MNYTIQYNNGLVAFKTQRIKSTKFSIKRHTFLLAHLYTETQLQHKAMPSTSTSVLCMLYIQATTFLLTYLIHGIAKWT